MRDQVTKETETYKTEQDNNIAQRIIYTIYGLVSAILAFRFIFKLLGANSENVFVRGIYAVTQPVVGIFEGIFSPTAIDGAEGTAVFEPETLIAMVVIALIVWAVLKLTKPRSGNRFEKNEYMKDNRSEKTSSE